jgi:HlyD family secretion protein
MVGTLERDRIEIKVESAEPILAIPVVDGQQVLAGTLLLQQDPARAQAKLAGASAERDRLKARLAELERGPRQEEIRESRARLEGQQALTVNAAAELQRVRAMFERELTSEAILDVAEANWKSATADETAAREALAALLNGTTPEELQQAAAAVEVAEAQALIAEIELQRTRLLAPVAGVVDKVLFELGERPPANTTVAVLLDGSSAYARVYVPEHMRARIQPGNEVAVRIDGVDEPLQGTVRWVSSDASFTPYFALTEHDRSRLSYLAEIDVPGAAGLPSGVPLEATLPAVE